MPWIVDVFDDKIKTALGKSNLSSLDIYSVECKSFVANELLDRLMSFILAEQGLDKLILGSFDSKCEPIEEEVLSRLANMCPNLSHLELSCIRYFKAGRISMTNLFRQILHQNPPI